MKKLYVAVRLGWRSTIPVQRTSGLDNKAATALNFTLPTVAKRHDDESRLESTLLQQQISITQWKSLCRWTTGLMKYDPRATCE